MYVLINHTLLDFALIFKTDQEASALHNLQNHITRMCLARNKAPAAGSIMATITYTHAKQSMSVFFWQGPTKAVIGCGQTDPH